MKTKFIELKLGSHQIVHGFDADNQEIIEEIKVEGFTKKLVNIDRVKSISEQFILTDYAHGRWIYWEYEGDFEELKKILI
ncbi:hypothetical protein [Tenacibaculum sp. M341]|uniref:hypothetical protein n=1 Tax=Tenacibaculum sp. M341 TaxID=2530339 RepID=UPI0010515057|nr:hypothetical protein [Tenacibaculum sp. M341]TCI91429.1 hypothetical protein EYW44_10770 [Tenacibaculum sp. M341]